MEGKIKIYCINLKHRADRWERFSSQPELAKLKSQYDFERFEGINGANLDIHQDKRISLRTKRNIKEHTRRDHEELDSAGGVGCYLSHTSVWKKFLESGESYAIIFEDDAVLSPGFTERFQAAMKDVTLLPAVPDLWSFSNMHDAYFDARGRPLPTAVRQYNYGPWTTKVCTTFTGYLVSKRGAERLLDNAYPIDMHVDMYACVSSDLGNILTAKHSRVSVQPLSIKENDTDIHIKESCPICDIPTKYREKGIIMLHIPVVLMGVAAAAGMWWLASGSRRR